MEVKPPRRRTLSAWDINIAGDDMDGLDFLEEERVRRLATQKPRTRKLKKPKPIDDDVEREDEQGEDSGSHVSSAMSSSSSSSSSSSNFFGRGCAACHCA